MSNRKFTWESADGEEFALPSTIIKSAHMKHGAVSKSHEMNSDEHSVDIVKKKILTLMEQTKKENKNKWSDPDFGPNASGDDEYGSRALYFQGKPPPAVGNSRYPQPDTLRWDRPRWQQKKEGETDEDKDDEGEEEDEEEDEYDEYGDDDEYGGGSGGDPWCKKGRLFKGIGAQDVKQGKLGDCWFLSALATLAAQPDKIRECFCVEEDTDGYNLLGSKGLWDQCKQYGIVVCRFMKNFEWYYVIIDDRIPVFDKSGKPVFAHGYDENELWVPLIEKAYAKLHGSYDSLIGGYIDYGLSDLTGMVSEQVVLRKTHLGYHETTGKLLDADPPRHEETNSDKKCFWKQMFDLSQHGSLMGCSIQPDPKAKNAAKVEAKVGFGLHQRHAYSITGVYEVEFEDEKIREFYRNLQQVYNDFKKVIEEAEDGSLASLDKVVPGETKNKREVLRSIQWLIKLKDTEKGGNMDEPGAIEKWYDAEWNDNDMYKKYKPDKSNGTLRFVACRNPWGRGEWTGPWGDESIPLFFRDAIQNLRQSKWDEVRANDENFTEADTMDMKEQVNISLGTDDGIFHMEYQDWKDNFTIVFRCLDFSRYGRGKFKSEKIYHGMRIKGEWSADTCGGGIQQRTWRLNPKYEIEIKEKTKLFVSLSQADGRLVYGKDYRQSTHPIGFHILLNKNGKEGDVMDIDLPPPYGKNPKKRGKIDFRNMKIETTLSTGEMESMEDQAMYKFNHATSCWCTLEKGRYTIVPSTYKRPSKEELELGAGPFHLSVFGCAEEGNEQSWYLISGETLYIDDKENSSTEGQQEGDTPASSTTRNPKLANQQKKDAQLKKDILYENVREKIIELSKKRGIHISTLLSMFKTSVDSEQGAKEMPLTPKEFKSRLLELGFLNSDITTEGPNNDFGVLAGEDNLLSQEEFYVMFEQHLEDEAMYERETVPKPEDDLVYVAPPTETPGNLYVNVVEARDLVLPSGWMSKNTKSNRKSQLINITDSAPDNAWQSDMAFDRAMILLAVLKRDEEAVDLQEKSDTDSKERDIKQSDKNDYDWKVTLYLNRPITLRRRKDSKNAKNSEGTKDGIDSNEDQSETEEQKNAKATKDKFYASIKDCHALVDGTYLVGYDDYGTGIPVVTVGTERESPYVKSNSIRHKKHTFKNGDFVIVNNAPYLPVFPIGEGKAVATRKAMFMYWDDSKASVNDLVNASTGKEVEAEDAAPEGVEETGDSADKSAKQAPLVTARQGTLLPFEDYDENKGIGYRVASCWREVPVNVETWLEKLDDYESMRKLAEKQGQDALYALKFITQLEIKIPKHNSLPSYVKGAAEEEVFKSNKLRRPHSALGDNTKPIEWREYSLSVAEQAKKISTIQESDNKMELLTSYLKEDTDKIIDEANIKKSTFLLQGGRLIVEPESTSDDSSLNTESKSASTESALGNDNTQNITENAQDASHADGEEAEERKVEEDPLQHYLDKRHHDQKYKNLDKRRINKFKRWIKQKQRNKYMQRDDEAKHEMRYVDVIKVSASQSGNNGAKAKLLSGEEYRNKTRHNFGDDAQKSSISTAYRRTDQSEFDSTVYHQLSVYVESVILKRVFTVIDIVEKVHLGSRKSKEVSKLNSTARGKTESDFVPIWQRCMRIAGLEQILSTKDRESQNIMKWFNRFDSNKSGTIDIKEFSAALKTMGFQLHKKEIKTLMERFDREGDGEIDYKEFAVWLNSSNDTIVRRRSMYEILQIMQKIYKDSIKQSEPNLRHWPLSNDQGALSQLRSIFKNGITTKIKELRETNAEVNIIEMWEDLLEQPLTVEEFKRVVRVFEMKNHYDEIESKEETPESYFQKLLEGEIIEGSKNILPQTATDVTKQKHTYVAERDAAQNIYSSPVLSLKSTNPSVVVDEDDPLNLDKTRDLAKQALEALASVAGQVEDDVDVTQAFSKFKVTRINDFCIVLMSDFVERLHEQMYSICDSKMVTPPDSESSEKPTEAEDDTETTKQAPASPQKQQGDEVEEAARALAMFKVDKDDKLPALIKLRIVLDDLNITNEVACSDLARLMKGDSVEHIEEKLRYLLRRKANNADGVTYWLVTLGVDRARKNIIAIARDPESQEEMKLVIEEDTSHIPILADLLAHSKYSKISSPKRLQKGERGKSMQSEFSDYLKYCEDNFETSQTTLIRRHEEDRLCPVFVSALQPAEERACRKLANRLLISRDTISGSMKLKLGESEAFVQALQDAFAENSFDFFINATSEALTFRVEATAEDADDGAENNTTQTKKKFKDVSVDKADAPDSLVRRRKRVLDAIRQKKRLRAYLSGTSSVLQVVFQSSDGATNESMNWTTFIGHLENMKNPYVAIEMLPKHSQNDDANSAKNFYQRTKADKDGGSQPWFNATFEVPYCPTTNALPIKHTDVMHLGFGRPKRIWREVAATRNRKLHANEISQKTLFLLIVQAIFYEPEKTEQDYFENWCAHSQFELDGRTLRLQDLTSKTKKIIYENVCMVKGHGQDALEFWLRHNVYEDQTAKTEARKYFKCEYIVKKDETKQNHSEDNNVTMEGRDEEEVESTKTELFETMTLKIGEKSCVIQYRMIPYALQNREKVVRSGNNRVIMKDPRYVVVSVRRNPKSGMLFGTAYDSRSANEYEIVGPDGWQKSWNFNPIKGSGQEASPPFLTGSKVEDEKQQKWCFDEEKRWQTFVHGKDINKIGEPKDYKFDFRNQDVFKFVDQFQASLWERLKSNVLYLGREITPRLMLTAFTTPLSNTKGTGGDQYIGDCEIPISLISSLGHDVGQQWFPIYRNDSYEQISAPQKTGEICLIYTFSTSKKYVDIAVGDKKRGQKGAKRNATNVTAKSAKMQHDAPLRECAQSIMSSQDALKKLEDLKMRKKKVETEKRRIEDEKSRIEDEKNRIEKEKKRIEKEKKRVEAEKEKVQKEKETQQAELNTTREKLKELQKRLQSAEAKSQIVTRTASQNNTEFQNASTRQGSKAFDEKFALKMKESELHAKKMEDDKKKLEKENMERNQEIADLREKLKKREIELKNLEMERKTLSEKSNIVLESPSQNLSKSNEIRPVVNTPTRPTYSRQKEQAQAINVSPRRSTNKRMREKQAANKRKLAEASIREKMGSDEEWHIYKNTLRQALGTVGKQIIVRNPNDKERSLRQLEKFLNLGAGDDGQLDVREFRNCLKDFNVSLNEDHIKLIMLHFDYDKDKTVSVAEVMKGIRESLIAWGDNRVSSPTLGLNAGVNDDNGLGPLPPWITRVKANNGRYYYKNHNTKTTSWTDPRLGAVAGGGLNAVRSKRG